MKKQEKWENIDFSSERQKAVLDLPGFRKRQIQQSFDSFHFNVYKKAGKINLFKLTIYFVQMFTGHNFLTYQKLNIIRFAAFIKGWLT
jgi:anaerobic magnesium-protoporphyrin IX monomethyl ester cyclase